MQSRSLNIVYIARMTSWDRILVSYMVGHNIFDYHLLPLGITQLISPQANGSVVSDLFFIYIYIFPRKINKMLINIVMKNFAN